MFGKMNVLCEKRADGNMAVMKHFTYFLSDTHLEPNAPNTTLCLLDFLQKGAWRADALYILGDFFEAWVGDDDSSPFNEQIKQALLRCHQGGLAIYLMPGNRDFLLGPAWTQRAGIQLIPDPSLIQLYGKPVLLLHGDSLCTLDHRHQAFRRKTKSRLYRHLFLSLPLSWRSHIGQSIRTRSKERHQTLAPEIMDVTEKAVQNAFQREEVDCMIHGHTHKPACHTHTVEDKIYQRIVLGDWHQQGSLLKYYEDASFELITLPFS